MYSNKVKKWKHCITYTLQLEGSECPPSDAPATFGRAHARSVRFPIWGLTAPIVIFWLTRDIPEQYASSFLRRHFNELWIGFSPLITHSKSMFYFYNPWKRQKTIGFLKLFSGYRTGTLAWYGKSKKKLLYFVKFEYFFLFWRVQQHALSFREMVSSLLPAVLMNRWVLYILS